MCLFLGSLFIPVLHRYGSFWFFYTSHRRERDRKDRSLIYSARINKVKPCTLNIIISIEKARRIPTQTDESHPPKRLREITPSAPKPMRSLEQLTNLLSSMMAHSLHIYTYITCMLQQANKSQALKRMTNVKNKTTSQTLFFHGYERFSSTCL